MERHPLYRVVRPAPGADEARVHAPLAEVFSLGPIPTGKRSSRRPLTALALSGELCLYSVSEIRDLLLDVAHGTIDLLIDLADVTLLSAGALGLFVALSQELEEHDGRLVLQGVTPDLERILVIGGLQRLLVTSKPAVVVSNRNGGRSLDVEVTSATPLSTSGHEAVTRQLLRLVTVRQPDELHLRVIQPGPAGEVDDWPEVMSALAELGGTLVLSSPASPGPSDRGRALT